jgi:hypothetical protein
VKLSTTVALVLAVLAGILEIVNRAALNVSPSAHTVIGLVLMFAIGVGVIPATATAIRRLIPLHLAVALTALVGILQVLQQDQLDVSQSVHAIIAFVLFVLASIGIAPTLATEPAPDRLAAATARKGIAP